MWLPASIYERIPKFWLVLGLLFIGSAWYLGTEYRLAYLYISVGAACVLRGLAVAFWRRRFRSDSSSETIAMSVDEIKGQAEPDDASA